MGEELLKVLADVKFDSRKCFIQCFEPQELIDLKERLHCSLPLIQLLGKSVSPQEIAEIAKYSQGIGPSLELLATRTSSDKIESTGLVESAKKAGLKVHPYTIRKHSQPKWSGSLDETHRFLLDSLHVDGFFTDYPDLGRRAVTELSGRNGS